MLTKKKHLSESEVEFYQIWINDLDNLGYKWPEIRPWTTTSISNNNSSNKLSQTIHFKAVEQEHSSNSNKNEKSFVKKKSEDAKISQILRMCKFETDKKIDLENTSQIENVILVTWVKTREQIELISNVFSIHFKLIVACYSSKIEGLEAINQFVVSNTAGGIALIDSANFRQCVFTATNMGYKLNSFIFAKQLHLFEFWNDGINVVAPGDKEMLTYYDYDVDNNKVRAFYLIFYW